MCRSYSSPSHVLSTLAVATPEVFYISFAPFSIAPSILSGFCGASIHPSSLSDFSCLYTYSNLFTHCYSQTVKSVSAMKKQLSFVERTGTMMASFLCYLKIYFRKTPPHATKLLVDAVYGGRKYFCNLPAGQSVSLQVYHLLFCFRQAGERLYCKQPVGGLHL